MVRRVLAALAVLSLVLGPVHGAAPPDAASPGVPVDVPTNAPDDASATVPDDASATVPVDASPTGPPAAATNAAADNEPPLADAGLDQTVPRDAVVLLDGRGSRDPDGVLVDYEWSIVAPDGSALAPACADCARTNFTASQVGTYAVTLAVTDDDGATTNDTLYVNVTTGEGPGATLVGPDRVTVGASATVTASLTAGAAPLSSLQWTVAGTTVSAEALAGDHEVANLTRTFPAPGNYTVAATVTDEDGLTATGFHTVTVVAPSPPPAPRPPADSGGGPLPGGRSAPIAAGVEPVVRGDEVVTGDRPLRGSYRLDVPGGTDPVRRVEWHTETGEFASGLQAVRNWEPGDHELFAVVGYRDGSRDVATFPDGSRRVVADPRPNLTLDSLATNGSIRGAVTGSDAYGNLRGVSVTVDGESVAHWSAGLDRFRGSGARRKRLAFQYREIVSGEVHRLRVVAEDARGQTATLERRVTPVGRPVVVRSEFVNDPVDSYHERIDPERYTAHHVVEIETPSRAQSNISAVYQWDDEIMNQLDTKKEKRPREDTVLFHSFWSGQEPGTYSLKYDIYRNGRSIQLFKKRDHFTVTPSKPELRYTIVTDGTPDQGTWGARVDASRSFDPDGTDVEYIWRLGANPISPDNSTAKFSSLELATLVVEDGYDLRASNEFFFESNYNPGLAFVEEVTEGPYLPNETVRFRVGTVAYKLPKNTYSLDLAVRTSSDAAEVVEWQRGEVTAEALAESGRYDHKDVGSKVWTGTIAVQASELARDGGMPKVTVYNTELPERNLDSRRLPAVSVFADAGTFRTNVEVTNLRYRVERPIVKQVTVQSPDSKEQYLAKGYSVEKRSHYGTEYLVEKRVQVSEARYETRQRSFASERNRRLFLETTPGWHAAGTETEVEWRTTEEYVWRSSPSGRGTYTGQTKLVKVARTEYRTMYEFRYEYRTFRGRTVSGTYWAFRERRPSHRATGRSKRVKVADAEYETRYRFVVTERERVTVVNYLAERRVLVQEPRYEWQQYEWTTDEALAKRLARLDGDYRIGGSSPTREWTLRKRVGTEVMVVDSYRNESNVIETRATVTWDVVRRVVNTANLNWRPQKVDSIEINRSYSGVAHKRIFEDRIKENN